VSRRILWAAPALAAATALTVSACGSHTDAAKNSATSTVNGVSTVNVTLANDGGQDACAVDAKSVPAGPVTFKVVNSSAPGITEMELLKDQRIVGEKENLAPGLDPVTFTATLDGGRYQIYCPGASNEYLDLAVTGQAAAAPTGTVPTILAKGTKDYSAYVVDQVNQLDSGVKTLDAAVQAGNVNEAKAAYAKARPFYERAESSVDGFVLPGFAVDDNAGNLDYLIDMRESTPVDAKVGWKGFHAIERDLFQGNTINPTTKALSTELVGNVGHLVAVVAPLQYKPEDLANGAADLIEEVQAFSHLDLVDFAGNVEGSQQAYASLRPGLQKIDPALVTTLDGQFQSVLTTLNGYRDPGAPGGYRVWTPQLRSTDAPKLTAVIQPLHESLATVAQKVVSAT
jgi:iron uptake system component EfeO